MYLEVFDVEHGACALITTSNGKRVMIDCGHNSTTGWKPSTELIARGIWSLDQLIVSNYDEDHVSGFPDLVGLINIKVPQSCHVHHMRCAPLHLPWRHGESWLARSPPEPSLSGIP